ncbi:putative phage abortive infection protein [Carboxylicivirga marina]|uniref:Phage abortive infection protein n=1 Tax=Carboxylicivirga marina TaxID=2800988 RepID=A0ABS1HMZ7_9BACT|nr:putative phage abortive infection protein [Carboxylicivirga marina]MBK3518917.1 putative phage abortive infection protein [Carboxylicivirga marina]
MDIHKEIEQAEKKLKQKQDSLTGEITSLNDKISFYTAWAWVFVIVGLAITLAAFFIYFQSDKGEFYSLNLLGDFMAGAVASLWSLAGLFFIYVAFLGQKQQLLNQQLEISLSQLEVKYTRLELAGQKQEMHIQNETMKQQKFENTFFQMLTLFHSIVDSTDISIDGIADAELSGRDCFMQFVRKLGHHAFNKESRGDIDYDIARKTKPLDMYIRGYDAFYQIYKSDLSHYFRTYYHIIKLIDKSDVENKKQYISIARAQLSSNEQILLFYNCLHKNGKDKFKPLIEEYCLFKNLDDNLLFNIEHKKAYTESAYIPRKEEKE